jgi:hypothetical protein
VIRARHDTMRPPGSPPAMTGSDEGMAKSNTERQAAFRKEMRKRAFVQHAV